MTPKTSAPDLSGLSADALAREIITCTRVINTSQRDPHFGRVTREEGLRRVAALSASIAAQTGNLAREIAIQLGKAEGNVATGDLTRYSGLVALADPSHPVWTALAAEVSAPERSDRGPIWSTTTDAERDGEKAERGNLAAEARARLSELSDERERRRQAEAAEIEVERLARHRAKSGVS